MLSTTLEYSASTLQEPRHCFFGLLFEAPLGVSYGFIGFASGLGHFLAMAAIPSFSHCHLLTGAQVHTQNIMCLDTQAFTIVTRNACCAARSSSRFSACMYVTAACWAPGCGTDCGIIPEGKHGCVVLLKGTAGGVHGLRALLFRLEATRSWLYSARGQRLLDSRVTRLGPK